MDEQQLIERLGAMGEDAPPMRYALDAPLTAGRRVRRRRRVAGMAASGTVFATAAAVALVVAQGGSGIQVVESPVTAPAAVPADGTPGPQAMTAQQLQEKWGERSRADAEIVRAALGPDWEVDDRGQVLLRPGSPTALRLPAGYEVNARNLTGRESQTIAQYCADRPLVEKGMTFEPCTKLALPDGRAVTVEHTHWVQPEATEERNTGANVRVLYDQADGDRVMLDIAASEPANGSTAPRRAEVRTWLDDHVVRLGIAATDPAFSPTSPEQVEAERAATGALEREAAIERGDTTEETAAAAYVDALGDDWKLVDREQVVLRRGSPTAERLPADYEARTQALAGSGASFGGGLESFCAALEEKGSTREACTEVTLPDGRTAHVQWSSWKPTPKDVQPNIGWGLRVIHLQADGDWVILDLSAGQSAGTATEKTQAAARDWLEDLKGDVVAAATDPSV